MRDHARKQAGFTLLELILATVLLTMFVIPMLEIVHKSRRRAFDYTLKREVQTLAQQKLFERIYYYSEETVLAGSLSDMSGNFEEQGRPNWEWEIPYPEIVSQGEQVLLEYTIRVFVPQLGDRQLGQGGGLAGGGGSSAMSEMLENIGGGEFGARDFARGYRAQDSMLRPANFELTTRVFPSEFWYEEQEQLAAQGVDTGYYGSY